MSHTELLEEFPCNQFPLAMRQFFTKLEHSQEVFSHGQLSKNGRFLGQIANTKTSPLMHRQVGDVLVIQPDIAFIGTDKPDDHVKTSGFTGTIRS